MSERQRIKVQRSAAGSLLGACVALGAEDLHFVDSDDEWLTIEKERTDDGLIIEIKVVIP